MVMLKGGGDGGVRGHDIGGVGESAFTGRSFFTYIYVPGFNFPGPFKKYGLNLISAWISNYIHYKVWDGITYPFSNFNDATVEVLEWINNFIPNFSGHMIAYIC